ncbi:MAG: glycosyltransferase, partial [Bacteroidota bacterium]
MVFIVVPVFNRVALTLKCLQSVANQTYKDYKVIVIDDGSTDGTAEMVQASFPASIIIKGDGNYYWTKCVNTGILSIQNQMTEKDFVLHVNNDTEFDPRYIENLLCF